MDSRMYGRAAGLGNIGAGLGQMFGGFFGGDPSKSAGKYLDQIPGQTGKYFDPFIGRGNRAGDILEGQYGNLLNDPSGMLNKIGQGYQQSPGFKFALQQAMQGAGHAAAAGGMAGSPQHEQQSMGLATNLANQDYNSWLQNALGLYGQGLSGEQNMYGVGFDASKSQADQIAQALAARSQLDYASRANRNQSIGGGIGSLIGGAGQLLAFL